MAQPEKRFKCGACEAAIFENEVVKNGKTLRLKKVSIQKRYRDADGNWNSTNSYDANDLPKLKLVADEAYRYLTLGQDGENGDSRKNSKSD
jgi:hypothetical protein